MVENKRICPLCGKTSEGGLPTACTFKSALAAAGQSKPKQRNENREHVLKNTGFYTCLVYEQVCHMLLKKKKDDGVIETTQQGLNAITARRRFIHSRRIEPRVTPPIVKPPVEKIPEISQPSEDSLPVIEVVPSFTRAKLHRIIFDSIVGLEPFLKKSEIANDTFFEFMVELVAIRFKKKVEKLSDADNTWFRNNFKNLYHQRGLPVDEKTTQTLFRYCSELFTEIMPLLLQDDRFAQ